jgi:hypothetical protein
LIKIKQNKTKSKKNINKMMVRGLPYRLAVGYRKLWQAALSSDRKCLALCFFKPLIIIEIKKNVANTEARPVGCLHTN